MVKTKSFDINPSKKMFQSIRVLRIEVYGPQSYLCITGSTSWCIRRVGSQAFKIAKTPKILIARLLAHLQKGEHVGSPLHCPSVGANLCYRPSGNYLAT